MLNFWRDKGGNFAILTALLAVPLFGAAGLALDFSQALAVKEDLQQTADATALGAVSKDSPYVAEARKMSGDGPITVDIRIEKRLPRERDVAKDMAEKNRHVIDANHSV